MFKPTNIFSVTRRCLRTRRVALPASKIGWSPSSLVGVNLYRNYASAPKPKPEDYDMPASIGDLETSTSIEDPDISASTRYTPEMFQKYKNNRKLMGDYEYNTHDFAQMEQNTELHRDEFKGDIATLREEFRVHAATDRDSLLAFWLFVYFFITFPVGMYLLTRSNDLKWKVESLERERKRQESTSKSAFQALVKM